jgi:PAS domain S-box-containing protein
MIMNFTSKKKNIFKLDIFKLNIFKLNIFKLNIFKRKNISQQHTDITYSFRPKRNNNSQAILTLTGEFISTTYKFAELTGFSSLSLCGLKWDEFFTVVSSSIATFYHSTGVLYRCHLTKVKNILTITDCKATTCIVQWRMLDSFKRFIQSTEVPTIVCATSDMRIVWAHSTLSLFGKTPDEIIGKPVECLMPEDMARVHHRFIKRYKDSDVGSGCIVGMDGRRIIVKTKKSELRPAVLRVGHPTPAYFIASFTDLYQVEKSASEQIGSIRVLTAKVTHDVRNALVPISYVLERILKPDDTLPEDIDDLVKTGLGAVDSMHDMLNDMLVAARITHVENDIKLDGYLQQQPVVVEPVSRCIDLVEFASSIDTYALAYRISNKNSKNVCLLINTKVQANIKYVIGPRGNWWRIITNILGNAIRHTECPGSVSVVLNVEYEYNNLQIIIKDEGCGMTPTELKSSMKLYHTTKTTNSDLKGTGLGLPIANELITTVGGKMEIESLIGVGTTITILLPFEQCDNSISPSEKQRCIMVVDDQPIILKMYERILTKNGYLTTIAHSGEEAIEIIKDSTCVFDGFVLDNNMKGMSGVELAKYLRDIEKYKGPIVLCTGGVKDNIDSTSLTSICTKGMSGNRWLKAIESAW